MMQFTEEQRKALIEHCKMNILQANGILPTLEGLSPDSEVARKVRKELQLQEIALAVLTAEPRGYIDAGTPIDEINILTENKILKTDIALYTAPPVAALKLPDVITLTEASKHTGGLSFAETAAFADGANWRLEEVKRLNAAATAAPEV